MGYLSTKTLTVKRDSKTKRLRHAPHVRSMTVKKYFFVYLSGFVTWSSLSNNYHCRWVKTKNGQTCMGNAQNMYFVDTSVSLWSEMSMHVFLRTCHKRQVVAHKGK